MRVSTLVMLPLALALPTASLAQGWIKYVNESDRFIVNFPREPDVRHIDYVSEQGATLPARVYTVQDASMHYAITVVDYSDAEGAHELLAARTGGRVTRFTIPGELNGAVAYAAWNIRRRGGEVTYDAWSSMDGVPGHQLQVRNDDRSLTFVAIHRLDRLLYILEGTVPESSAPPAHFQQSLGFLDGQGRRASYEYDEDGTRFRVDTSYEWIGVEDPVTGEVLPP